AYPADKYSVDVATYAPSSGWSAFTRLDEDSRDTAPPLIDPCGNATLVWTRYPGYEVMTARRLQGGSWTTPLYVGVVPSTGNARIADGAGASGEVIASWRTPGDDAVLAAVLR